MEHPLRSDELQDVSKDDWQEGPEAALHTSGGVLVAAANHLLTVVDASGGKVEVLEGNEGRVA